MKLKSSASQRQNTEEGFQGFYAQPKKGLMMIIYLSVALGIKHCLFLLLLTLHKSQKKAEIFPSWWKPIGNYQKSNQRNKSEASWNILQLQSISHLSQGQYNSELYSQGNFTKWWQRVFREKWETVQRTGSAKKIK